MFQKMSRFTLLLLVLLSLFFAAPCVAEEEAASASKTEAAEEPTFLARANAVLFGTLFFDITGGAIFIEEVDRNGKPVLDESGNPKSKTIPIPFLVAVLFSGGVFFTFWFSWINLRALKHSVDVIAGKFDRPEDEGEISHFQALTSALSATVGLGNIAGVAVAIQTGGPGAVFWMILTALFGMSSKFSSCTLSQLYRKVNSDGSISGGPMYYLDIGLGEKGPGWARFGKILAVMFAFMVMGGAVGGGNMFQANQTAEAFVSTFALGEDARAIIGCIMAVLVAVVILGGIKRIGAATSRLVPAMCGIYVIASLFVIIVNIGELPSAIGLIFSMAFSKNAFFGGLVGVLVTGVTRAAFSNEAGLGSAAIAHAAAKTDEPVREGLVAMIGPVIDTMLVCLMTASVVILTGAWNDPELAAKGANLDSTLRGVSLTADAFASVIPWFPYVLTICIALFAYSTMISWCYYGERGWIYLLDHFGGIGLKTVVIYRVIFVGFIIVGSVNKLSEVLDFSDAMILSMALPNIIGSIFLAPQVKEKLNDYWSRYKSGELKPVT